MTIRSRIILGFLIIVAAAFYWLTNWLIADLRPHYLKSMEEALVDQATVLASMVATSMDSAGLPYDDLHRAFADARQRRFAARIYDFVKVRTNVRVYITDTTGLVVFDSDGARDEGKDYSEWNDVHLTLQGSYGARATRTDADDPSTSVLYVAAPIVRAGALAGVLTVAKPADSVNRFVELAEKQIITGALAACGVVVLLGVLLSMWVTAPVRRLTEYARAVSDNRPVTLPRLGRSEMAVMGKAMEEMRESLEGKRYVEQYVQALTHELKSPLSAIRGAAELLEEDMPPEQRATFTENIRQESNRMQGIVDRMLQLSSLEKRRTLRDVEQLDLSTLIEDIATSVAPQVEQSGVSLEIDAAVPLRVRAERFLLRQAIVNLVQNALDFAPRPGAVTLRVEPRPAAATVIIEDNGPGIPDYALHKVYDRFFSLPRPATQRKSSGLGLSIVRLVAELHGGTITLSNRPEGGARAELVIPYGSAAHPSSVQSA